MKRLLKSSLIKYYTAKTDVQADPPITYFQQFHL
jgi:hypothetical protein